MIWKPLVFAFLLAGVFADDNFLMPDKVKDYLRTHCKNAGADDAKVDEIINAVQSSTDCAKGLVNVEEIKTEIEAAKPNGALDEVFKKYCAKTPQLKTCIHTLLDAMDPCFDESTRGQVSSAKNGTDQLIDFVCYKDGDRIALFIAEGGPECITSKQNGVRECANTLKGSVKSMEDIKAMSTVAKCTKFDELSTCIVNVLEQCSTPTPANMAESLLRYIRKGTPCNTELPK